MHKFVRSFITEWRKLQLPFKGESIVVAVSGGADSMAMLLAIHDLTTRRKLAHRVIVAHFNHKLRGSESDKDEQFVRDYADRLGFEFKLGIGRLRSAKGNLEQAARDARYKFLVKTARACRAFAIVTAHTQNDQAETLLLNLIRGSGPDGLSGMTPVREIEGGIKLVRPLLSWAVREDTEGFVHANGVEVRTDAMNTDERFSRVQIRRQILPMLARINPKIVQSLARTANLMAEMSAAIPDPGVDLTNEGHLYLNQLKSLPRRELFTALRSWLRANRGNLRSLELKHIEAIERLILSPKSGRTVELPGGGRVKRQGGRLVFANIKVEK